MKKTNKVHIWHSGKLPFSCQKFAKNLTFKKKKIDKNCHFFSTKLPLAILLKNDIFCQFFDSQMAIFRMVRFTCLRCFCYRRFWLDLEFDHFLQAVFREYLLHCIGRISMNEYEFLFYNFLFYNACIPNSDTHVDYYYERFYHDLSIILQYICKL